MMRVDTRSIRVADLNRAHIEPALEQALAVSRGGTTVPPWLRAPLIARLFEAVSWLSIGTTCGYYRVEDANAILSLHQKPMRAMIGFYSSNNMAAFSPALEWAVFQTVQDGYIGDSWTWLNEAVAVRVNPEEVFLSGLLMSQRLTFDSLAEISSLFVTYSDDTSWDTVSTQMPSGQEIEEALSGRIAASDLQLTNASLGAGFLRLLDHMVESEAFFQGIEETAIEPLVRQLGAVQAWRLRLGEPDIRLRFNFLVQVIRRSLRRELPLADSSEVTDRTDEFNEAFSLIADRLAQSWNRDHPLWLGASAF